MSNQKKLLAGHENMYKKNPQTYEFDLKVKVQGRISIMNVRDTLYHGDTLKCQTKYDYVKGQKNLRPEHKAMS